MTSPDDLTSPKYNVIRNGRHSDTGYTIHQPEGGLTKREHFAAMAMQGLITLKGSDCQDSDITAKQCVRMADALIAELNK